MSAADRVARARSLLGVKFRLHGRQPEFGLDCVGLVAIACDANEGVPSGYSLRNSNDDQWTAILDQLAERRIRGEKPGDIILLRAGPALLHLGIWTGDSLIHAHALIGQIVETPGRPAWPIIGIWHPK
jgi:murein DD-endopeptidase / murein LD-carboxypeptidase